MSWQEFGCHIRGCLDNRKQAPDAAGLSWTFNSSSEWKTHVIVHVCKKEKNGIVVNLAADAPSSDSRLQAILAVLSLF